MEIRSSVSIDIWMLIVSFVRSRLVVSFSLAFDRGTWMMNT